MNILQINSSDTGGGAEGSARNLFRAYRERGHRSWLAVGTKLSDDPDILQIPSFSARFLKLFLRLPHPESFRRLTDRLRHPSRLPDWWCGRDEMTYPGCHHILRLCPAKPDIIHCHNLHDWYFDLRLLPQWSRRFPLILNLRDTWTLTGHCAYFMDCDRWQSGCGNCPRLNVYPACRRDATAFNWRQKADIFAQSRLYVTAPSQWLLDCVARSMLQPVQTQCIPNGIDTTVFTPGSQQEARHALQLPMNVPLVLFASASAQNHYKAPDSMADALEQLHAALPEAQFVCVGATPPRTVPLHYIPYIKEPHRMALCYRAADVFIHTARAEAFGKTVTEAMACGTPTVASNVGGLREQILHGETGFLGDTAAELAAHAAAILRMPPQQRSAMREAAARRGAQFSLTRQVNAFLSWYEEILANHRQRASCKA